MTLHPIITFEQWKSINAVMALRVRRKPSISDTLFGVFGGIVIGASLALLMIATETRVIGAILALAFWLYYALARVLARRKLAANQRTHYQQMQPILNGNRMDIDAVGIRGTWVGGNAIYNFAWPAFIEQLDRPEELVFLYAPCCHILVPKAELSTEDIQLISGWFNESRLSNGTPDFVRGAFQ